MRKFLADAIEANVAPRVTHGDSTILKHNGSYRVLVNPSGDVTRAGKAYQTLTGTQLEASSWEPNQVPKRSVNVETIKLRSGKEKEVRRYDPTATSYQSSNSRMLNAPIHSATMW